MRSRCQLSATLHALLPPLLRDKDKFILQVGYHCSVCINKHCFVQNFERKRIYFFVAESILASSPHNESLLLMGHRPCCNIARPKVATAVTAELTVTETQFNSKTHDNECI
jgi:hypothetical protein